MARPRNAESLTCPPPRADATLLNCLSDSILPHARWLGLNLVGVHIRGDEGSTEFDHVIPGNNTWNNNAVDEVCRSADALDLQVLVRDEQIDRRFMGERIMLHPESTDDFDTYGGYSPADREEFRQFVLNPSPFATTLAQRIGGDNCIYMQSDAGAVGGMTLTRLSEMSAYLDGDPEDPNQLSGLYQVSVIVLPRTQTGFPLPNDDATPVLNVTISYTDPITGFGEHVFALEGRQLWEGPFGARTRLTGVQEIVIGAIEVQQTNGRAGGDIIFVDRQAEPENQARWNQTGINDVRGPRRLREHHDAGILAMRGDFDIQISYGTDDVHLWLDAVCLTNPATFGLWHPANPGTLPSHSGYRTAMDTRLDFLCRNNDPTLVGVGGIPGLRFVMGAEQVFNNGTYWSTFLLSRLIAAETGNQVQLFSTYGAWTNTTLTPILAAEMITGPYNYPLLTDHPRPTMQGVTPQDYLPTLYDVGAEPDGFRGMWDLFLPNIQTRSLVAPDQPWIPYIQNHTNLLATNPPPGWWDNIPNREPSASELRFQCNTALAFGASGVLFYSFSSVPYTPVVPTTPPTVFAADRILPNPGIGIDWFDPIDMNVGTLGFLGSEGVEDARRTLDWNGENKWDSTQAYIDDFLRPAGSYLSQYLQWQRGLQWYCRGQSGAGSSELVSMVVSRRQDIANGIDPQGQTYVMVSEFDRRGATPPPESTEESRFLFVLNGNTYDGPLHAGTDPVGQRHITVKLGTDGGRVDEWRVTNVLTNDVWIVRAADTPDETSYANGFTEYFAPGAAALYRLDPMVNESTDFTDTFPEDAAHPCPNRSVFIEPMATLRLDAADILAFGAGNGIFCDGELISIGSSFGPCTIEGNWEGIIARNGGSVDLQRVTIIGAGVTAGSNGTATLDEACDISQTHAALRNIGGSLSSNATRSTGVFHHLESIGNGTTWLDEDNSTGNAQYGSTALEVWGNGGGCYADETVFSNFWRGAYIVDALLWGDADGMVPVDGGNNSFRSQYIGLQTAVRGFIGLGDALLFSAPENHNEIIISNPQGYSAKTDGTSWIEAVWNWWEPADWSYTPPPLIRWMGVNGSVVYQPALTQDPIPFTGSGTAEFFAVPVLTKSAPFSPPPSIRGQVRAAMVQQNRGSVRHLIGQFLQSTAASTADYDLLRFLHRTLRKIDAPGAIDTMLTLCLSRSDLESKLLAADIATEDSMYTDAVQVLNAYSFSGSVDLQKRALVRKILLYPLAWRGGYQDGLLALDSLRACGDSTLLPFIEWYPTLYSRLSHAESATIPKSGSQRIIDRVLPTGIDVWPNYPNPFTDVTSFTFKLGEEMHVRLAVYDAMGREVAVVTDADYSRGVHSAVLRSDGMPSGLYLYRLTTDAGVIQRKMLLMR